MVLKIKKIYGWSRTALLIVFFVSLFIPSQSFGVTISGNESFIVTTTPQNPGPQETVTLRIISYLFDSNRAEIVWTVNGETFLSGRGKTELSIKSGDLGTTKKVVALVKPYGEYTPYQQTILIQPLGIDLMWEADSSVPPFYHGKALATRGNNLTITALPTFITTNGTTIPTENLLYSWSIGGTRLTTSSGFGKQSVKINTKDLQIRSAITVTVANLDGSLQTTKSLTVPLSEPNLILYEQNPLTGLRFEQAIRNKTNLQNKEITLVAFPFYFNNEDVLFNQASYEWRVNGKKASTKQTQTFRGVTDSFTSKVSTQVLNLNNSLQYATTEATIVSGANITNEVWEF